ncbi:PREDICTED: cation/calcium exchanger 1-like [Tarenaya hassleriana]|uniref:cation/calcium exchanger 1-like n=1 Tax=Tarenaya hassleriana TaxID=28532 RepID=UPI00053C135A|nr:PREDICTED: cation/calcium exchanger 1-like [Tarenaya hassleriana]
MASLFSSHLNSRSISLLLSFFFVFLVYLHLAPLSLLSINHPVFLVEPLNSLSGDGCGGGLTGLADHRSKCSYVRSQPECAPQGYIDYLEIFYCVFGNSPLLGHLALTAWLLALFYLLGDTAGSYFVLSLESLSKLLKLSPTIAGATLLSLGNGAPDLFSSVVSFSRSNNGDFGLNSVLGGSFFVSSFVVGTICMLTGSRGVSIDKNSFIRDVVFLLISLGCLCLIIIVGKITIWFALCYLAIYFVYVGFLSASRFFNRKKPKPQPIQRSKEELAEMGVPFLGYVDDEKPVSTKETDQEPRIDQEQEFKILNLDHHPARRSRSCISVLLTVLGLPLNLPRRLTIPVIHEERWSRTCAVVSTALSPVLLTELYSFRNSGSKRNVKLYVIPGSIGSILGVMALLTTKKSHPPKKFTLVWLLGGFIMSVAWTYIIAQELVSLLVSLGYIFGTRPSVLGLTVLAWGNSLGDLIANVTVALHGGTDGVQTALSGCYAGPLFNSAIGLGVPLVMSSLAEYPRAYAITTDDDSSSLLETLGFLMVGLLWALVIMPKRNMRLDKLVGGGLVAIYLCFLFLRLVRVFGIVL